MKVNDLFRTGYVYLDKYIRYVRAGVVCAAFAGMLAVGVTGGGDPISGAYKSYEDQSENEELKKLLTDYYSAYAEGDVKSLEKIANPISDKEKSYIRAMSDYIKAYDIKEISTKPGADDNSLLVSVTVGIKYKKLVDEAPGLDFFYVVRNEDDGGYKIDNRYSTFNAQNGEYAVDPTVTALIAAFERQDDVIDLQGKVSQEFNTLTLENKDFNVFFTKTLPEAVTDWAADYKKEEEKQAKKEEEKKKEEKAKEKKAQEEASSETVIARDKVNVRKKPGTDAESLGQVAKGTELKRYSEKGDWSKVEFNDSDGWIKSEFLKVKEEKEDKDNKEEEKESQEATAKKDSKVEEKEEKEETKTEEAEEKEEKKEETKTEEKEEKKEESADKDKQKEKRENTSDTVYVKEKVNVRAKRSTDSATLGQASAGTALKRYKEKDGWSKVVYNGKKAWIRSDFLTSKKPADSEEQPEVQTNSNLSPGKTVTLSSSVNVRKSMDENSDRVALAYAGDNVTVEEVYGNGWTKVLYNGKEGYMKTEYVK